MAQPQHKDAQGVATVEPRPFSKTNFRSELLLCLPALLGFALFLLSFPIDRVIPFWPHLSLAVVFLLWFLFVAPITTATAFVKFNRGRRRAIFPTSLALLGWT